jgi:protein phosphatase
MTVEFYGDSDIGRVRRVNEDSFRLIPERDTVVVCDGMGGHAAGEIASHRAVETVTAYLMRGREVAPAPKIDGEVPSIPAEAEDLVWAVRLANRRVFQTAQDQKQTRGMGTTLVAVRFGADRAVICHVGDSRAYLLRDGQFEQLTTDHSLVAELLAQKEITPEQARTFPDRNIITRALGTRPVVAVDMTVLPTQGDDWFLLCSDGLCGLVDDDEMQAIVMRHPDDPQAALTALIETANRAGGHDNITVAIARVRDGKTPGTSPRQSLTIPETDDDTAAVEQKIIEALFRPGLSNSDLPDDDTDKIPIRPENR